MNFHRNSSSESGKWDDVIPELKHHNKKQCHIDSEAWHLMKVSWICKIKKNETVQLRCSVSTENWACSTWMLWPSLSGQHHILSFQLCTRSCFLLTAEWNISWLPPQHSAIVPMRWACSNYSIHTLVGYMLWFCGCTKE